MQAILEKAAKIKLAIFDLDGVLTDGLLYYNDDGVQTKAFHVHDGQGLKYLQKTGVTVAVITGSSSKLVDLRMKDLGITHFYKGKIQKLPILNKLLEELQLTLEEVAFCGDDLPDLPLLTRVGLSIAVPNAHPLIRQNVLWHTQSPGGNGAVREICELIMTAQNTWPKILAEYHE